MILIFSLLFKANYEEFAAPPAVKRAMGTANSEECTPPPSKKSRDDKAARSVPTPMQSGHKPKRQWATRVENPAIQASDIDTASMQAPLNRASMPPRQVQPSVPALGSTAQVTAPVQVAVQPAQEINDIACTSALLGPLIAAPSTLGQEVTLQHAMSDPSDTQAQTDYANVSIFSYLSISSNVFSFSLFFNINLSQRDINPSPPLLHI